MTPTPKGRLIRAIETKVMSSYYENNNQEGVEYESADQLASAIALSPDIVIDSKRLYCTIELEGKHTRGQMICDWAGISKREPNVKVIMKVDIALFKKLLIMAVS